MVRRDTLIMALRETTDTTALTMGQVDRLFVTDGSRARGADAWRWGAMGLGLGIAAAAFTEMGACKPGEQCGAMAPKLLMGGAAGGASGFLLGQFRTQERWTRVAIPRSLRGERSCPSARPFRFP